jgi:RNA polymerase sigma factor (sigma-70 family)
MSKGQLSIALEQLRGPLQAQALEFLTDGQLLERFLIERQETVFAALVHRHAAMVLSVAHKVLHDTHDAEDVFQATFLVLAKKAASIRRRQALAGWLYQIVYHLALKAKAENARRHAREKAARNMQSAEPDTNLIQSELQAVLGQELSRLPEKYRTPLILHYLEGKSKAATACQLECTEGTVSGRLDRARKLLCSRMIRRGFVLSVSGISTLLRENAATAAISPALQRTAIQAALAFMQGVIPANLAQAMPVVLAQGMLKKMVFAKIRAAAILMLGVSALAAGAGALSYQALASKAKDDALSRPESHATTQSSQPAIAEGRTSVGDADDMTRLLSASGKVVDSKSNPVTGATIYLREQPTSWSSSNWHPSETRNLARTNTDSQGQFKFESVDLPLPRLLRQEAFPLDVIVVAKGYALAWKHLRAPQAKFDLSFTLRPESKIQGRLLDEHGKPASNVAVRAIEIMPLTAGARPSNGHRGLISLSSANFLNLEFSDIPLQAETGTDGSFMLAGLPADVRADLLVADDRFPRKEFYAATTDKPQPMLADYPGGQQGEPARGEAVYTNNFSLTLQAGGRFHGKIIFEDTGQSAVGARVTNWQSSPEPYVTTDAAGRFSIGQLPLRTYWATVYPPEGFGYLGETVAFELTPQSRVEERTIKLRRGTLIKGRISDEETGRGIPEVEVYYVPSNRGQKRWVSFPWTAKSKTDGTFHISVPAGKGHLIIPGFVPGYVAGNVGAGHSIDEADSRFNREIEIREGQPVKEEVFTLGRGFVIFGRITDPQGKPVPAAQVHTNLPTGDSGYLPQSLTGDADGRFFLGGLKAGRSYRLIFNNKQRTLAAVQTVIAPADKSKVEVIVKLTPTASLSGRVLDEDNQPVAEARVRASSATTLTDAQGKFLLTRVLPDEQVSVDVWAEGYSFGHSAPLKSANGKEHVVPDITLLKMDQSVSGLIVDQNGKPPTGVRLYASSEHPQRPQITSPEPTTDRDGRFRITGLPRGAIQVWGVLPWDRQHSSLLKRMEAGQHEVKIVVTVPDP